MRRPASARWPAVLLVLAAAVVAIPTWAGGPARSTHAPSERPAWSDLNAEQRHLLAAFESQWNGWPAAEKRVWLALAGRFPEMPPAEQLKARQRIRQWALLTPEQRRVARANYGLAKRLPEQERVEQWHRYQGMTAEQRSVLRTHGWTSNTAARFAGSRTGLAKEAAKPLADAPTQSR